MPALEFSCDCGTLRGALKDVSPKSGIRYVCYCDDCQAFAEFLGREADCLDAHGGTDVFQTPASRLTITAGADRLACVQVTHRPLLRWYAACCQTPIANTYGSSKRSFLSMILVGFQPTARDAALGPVSGHAWTNFAEGDLGKVKPLNIPAMLVRIVTRIIGARLTGDYRRNPLFDRATGAPIATPRRLTGPQRSLIDARIRKRRLVGR